MASPKSMVKLLHREGTATDIRYLGGGQMDNPHIPWIPIRKSWGRRLQCGLCLTRLWMGMGGGGGGRQNSRQHCQGFSWSIHPGKATVLHHLHGREQVRDGSKPRAWPCGSRSSHSLSAPTQRRSQSLSPLALTPQNRSFCADAETSPCNQVLFWTVHLPAPRTRAQAPP